MTVTADSTLQFLKSGVFLAFLSCFVLSLVFPLVCLLLIHTSPRSCFFLCYTTPEKSKIKKSFSIAGLDDQDFGLLRKIEHLSSFSSDLGRSSV